MASILTLAYNLRSAKTALDLELAGMIMLFAVVVLGSALLH